MDPPPDSSSREISARRCGGSPGAGGGRPPPGRRRGHARGCVLPCPIVGAATSFSSSGGLEVHPSESSVHMTARIIQLAGALLGTLFGFALGLALLRSTGDLIEPANGPAFLTAFVVAMFLFGY